MLAGRNIKNILAVTTGKMVVDGFDSGWELVRDPNLLHDSAMSFVNGKLKCKLNTADTNVRVMRSDWMPTADNYDVELEAELTKSDDGCWGIVFDHSNQGQSQYQFAICPKSKEYYLRYFAGGWNYTVKEVSEIVAPLGKNILKLEKRNGRVKLYVNNQSLGEFNANLNPKGNVGLSIRAPKGSTSLPVEILFDSVKFTDFDAQPEKDCSKQILGDINCDGKIDLMDFVQWKKGYLGL